MSELVKAIFLDAESRLPITIPLVVYVEIVQRILATRVCGTCGLAYTSLRPRVAANTCLSCYLKRQEKPYVFLGNAEPDEDKRYPSYLFLNEEGMVCLSTTATESAPFESITFTLDHHDFPLPTDQQLASVIDDVQSGTWAIRGEVNTYSVVVLEYIERSGSYRSIPFLSYKHKSVRYLDKRRGTTRRLYRLAKQQYDATTSKSQRWDSELYKVLAKLASDEEDANPQKGTLL